MLRGVGVLRFLAIALTLPFTARSVMAGFTAPVLIEAQPSVASRPLPPAPVLTSPDGSLWTIEMRTEFVTTYESTDGGVTWSRRNTWVGPGWTTNPLPEVHRLFSASGSGDLDVIVRESGYEPIPRPISHSRSHDGGTTWSRLTPVGDATVLGMVSVARSPDGLVAVAWVDDQPDRPLLLAVSRDDGRSWSEPLSLASMEQGLQPNVLLLWPDAGSLLVCWDGSFSRFACRRSADGGADFSPPVHAPSLPLGWSGGWTLGLVRLGAAAVLRVFQAQDPDRDIQVLGLRSDDGGSTWSPPVPIGAGSNQMSVAGHPSTGAWVSSGYPPRLWRSADGIEWKPVPLPPGLGCSAGHPFLVHPFGPDRVTVGDRTMFRSLDAGASWDEPRGPVPPPYLTGFRLLGQPPGPMAALWTRGEDRTAVIHASISADGGRQWSLPSRVSDLTSPLGGFAAIDRSTGDLAAVWVAQAACGEGELRASRSTDGVLWNTSVPVASNGHSPGLAEDGDGRLVATWVSAGDLVSSSSTDGGLGWSPPRVVCAITSARNGTMPPSQPVTAGDGAVLVVARNADGALQSHRTIDGGESWTSRELGLPDAYAAELVSAGSRLVLIVDWRPNASSRATTGLESLDSGWTWSSIDPGTSRCEGCLLTSSSTGAAVVADWTGSQGLRALLPTGGFSPIGDAGWTPRLEGLEAAAAARADLREIAFLFRGEALRLPPGVYFTALSGASSASTRRAVFETTPSAVEIGRALPFPRYLEMAFPGMNDPWEVLLDPRPLFLYDVGAETRNGLAVVKSLGVTVRLSW